MGALDQPDPCWLGAADEGRDQDGALGPERLQEASAALDGGPQG